ncbi:HEPN domain-containing protein [Streptomyces sp. HNM0574]|uniref:HEPN domain-containing protein n=1 Tax=Streptomyces sp. HNM0574 TaxID=2714954 RepID=UPI00146C8C44|nr:HEPN domain-containing protein [Streptomyces sp. HNM0574]
MALERRTDAVELRRADREVACLYYLGFTAECFAKALCAAKGRTVPREHNVLAILTHAGFSPRVLPPEVQNFLTDRDVGLRYQPALPEDVKIEDEIKAATRFVTWCTKQLRRRTKAHRRNAP